MANEREKMVPKSKIANGIMFLWAGFIAFSFPFCFGWIFLNITGHSKGYSYDLGAEKDVSIMLGCIELLIWLAIALPSEICAFRRAKKKGKVYIAALAVIFVALAAVSIVAMGGWSRYIKGVFNI